MTTQPPPSPRRTLVVGCPVRGRHWILDTWDRHVRAAVAELDGVDLMGYQFVTGSDDHRTLDVIAWWQHDRGLVEVRTVDEPQRLDTRSWSLERLALMVGLRNALLADVRRRGPDLFLSIDSDMLLAPGALRQMLETLDANSTDRGVWAVGGKAYMLGGGEDRSHPSFGVMAGTPRNRSFVRGDTDQVIDVDVIMGIKLMAQPALNVDYRYSKVGEDVGWSLAVREQGGRLMWDGRTASKHVTEYPWLYLHDQRVGY